MATGAGAGVRRKRCPLSLALLCLALITRVASTQTYVVVVSGVGGDPQFSDRFLRWGTELVDAVRQRLAVPESNLVLLAEGPERDPRISGPASKERLEAELRRIGERVRPGDDLVLVLLGHGSDRDGQARFNLVGPDVTATELATWLAGVKARRTVVVNTSSASGGFVPALAGPGRVVVTATKSGFERNATQFGEYFVRAIATGGTEGTPGAEGAEGTSGIGGADTDKDGRLSVLEVFEYARREVARACEQEKRLLTEHALLEDDGDGKGSTEPSATGRDGALAASVFLTAAKAPVTAETADPEAKRLYVRRDSLERRVVELRGTRGSMAPDVYERELEELLVELAMTNRTLRERERRRP